MKPACTFALFLLVGFPQIVAAQGMRPPRQDQGAKNDWEIKVIADCETMACYWCSSLLRSSRALQIHVSRILPTNPFRLVLVNLTCPYSSIQPILAVPVR
jgi:hypothetical protein